MSITQIGATVGKVNIDIYGETIEITDKESGEILVKESLEDFQKIVAMSYQLDKVIGRPEAP